MRHRQISPLQIKSSTPLSWHRADSQYITIATGVSNWKDLSGNGFDFSQPTSGNQPVYSTNGFNGQPQIQLTAASSHYLSNSNGLAAAIAGGINKKFTIYMAAKIPNAGNNNELICFAANTTTTALMNHYISSANNYQYDRRATDGTINTNVTVGLANGTPSSINNNTIIKIYYDGYKLTTKFGNNIVGTSTQDTIVGHTLSDLVYTSLGVAQLGSGGSTLANFTTINIAEIIIYNGLLSTNDDFLLGEYFQNRYGIITNNYSWDPNFINSASLLSWHNAKKQNTMLTGTGIATWYDISGNGYNVTQGTGASQPTYSSSSIFSGNSTLHFNGSQFLDFGASYAANFNGTNSFEIWSVWSIVNTNTQMTAIAIGHNSNSQYIMTRAQNLANLTYEMSAVVLSTTGVGVTVANNRLITRSTYSPGAGNAKLFHQNVAYTPGTSATSRTLSLASIGRLAFNGATNSILTGEIAEILVISGNLNNDESNLLSNYFINQWGTFP